MDKRCTPVPGTLAKLHALTGSFGLLEGLLKKFLVGLVHLQLDSVSNFAPAVLPEGVFQGWGWRFTLDDGVDIPSNLQPLWEF